MDTLCDQIEKELLKEQKGANLEEGNNIEIDLNEMNLNFDSDSEDIVMKGEDKEEEGGEYLEMLNKENYLLIAKNKVSEAIDAIIQSINTIEYFIS